MNIQEEVIKIHAKFGMSEKANYEIQLLCEKYAKQYHEQQVKNCLIAGVVESFYCNQDDGEYNNNPCAEQCNFCKEVEKTLQ